MGKADRLKFRIGTHADPYGTLVSAMRGQRRVCLPIVAIVAFLGATSLSGCMGTGSGSLDYNPAVRNAPGTITFGDTKLYSREALINERAADIAWIDKLIAASEDPTKVSFKPTLIREMEEISAFSAALGVRYDPAAGVSYRRSNETGEIQQEIDVLKAKVALAQLRRDIELIEAKFPSQTAPVNSGLGTVGAAAAVASPSAVTPPDAAQVAATVNALITSVTGRLDAETKPIGKTEVVSSPADDFQDRLAYRNMLKAARNAAGLDELHDTGNNRLVRLNLQATVVPDPSNAQALGVIQVKIDEDGAMGPSQYLESWLRDVNAHGDWRVDPATFRSSKTLDALEDSGDFSRIKVGTMLLLLPVLSSSGIDYAPSDLLARADWDQANQQDLAYFGSLLAALSVGGDKLEPVLAGLCGGGSPLALALDVADARTKSYDLVRAVNLAAIDLGIASPISDAGAKYESGKNYKKQVLDLIAGRQDCVALVARYSGAEPTWRALRRPELGGADQVRVYEVGPREQAQQVSTVARSANSLALAVSLAAAAPGAGVAGNLGAGFRRDIMNRASSLDRMPEVIGYSVGGKRTFGWVIGPHATTDSRGLAKVQQVPKSYDLSVDLSLPSWWRSMKLKITSVWAPSPRQLTDGMLAAAGSKRGPALTPVELPVPLVSAAADYESFTQFLIGASNRAVAVEEVIGGPVNGCAATTLFIKGPNLWRAEKVMLLGMSLGHDTFVIAPDMRGIIVNVPAVAAIPGEVSYKQDNQVHVLTSLGERAGRFAYDSSLSGDTCKAKPAPADPTAVTITKVDQDNFVVPSLVRIDVTGKNLAKVDLVRLDNRKGSITDRVADGTSFTAEFSRDITEGIDAGTVKLEFFSNKKSVGTAQNIRISRH